MCLGGGRSAPAPPPPQRLAVQPPLKTPAPVRDIPTPQRIKEETEDPNLITGKKKSKLKIDQIRKGVKAFDAIDPSINLGTPQQGLPKP
tara:strand:+ start:75 stop:341 length:267 start_codon:yes stop_codon:yes gene_type:complete